MNIWKRFLSLVVTASLLLGMIVYIPAAKVEAAAVTPAETLSWDFTTMEELPSDLTVNAAYSLSDGNLLWTCTSNHSANKATVLANVSGSESWTDYIVTTEVTTNYNATAGNFSYPALLLYGDIEVRVQHHKTNANAYYVGVYQGAWLMNSALYTVNGGSETAEDVADGQVSYKVAAKIVQGQITVYINDVEVCTYTYTGANTCGTAGVMSLHTSNAGCADASDTISYKSLTIEPVVVPATEEVYNSTGKTGLTITDGWNGDKAFNEAFDLQYTGAAITDGYAEVTFTLPETRPENVSNPQYNVHFVLGSVTIEGTLLYQITNANALYFRLGIRNSEYNSTGFTQIAKYDIKNYNGDNEETYGSVWGKEVTMKLYKVGNYLKFDVAIPELSLSKTMECTLSDTYVDEAYTVNVANKNVAATFSSIKVVRFNKTAKITLDDSAAALVTLPSYNDPAGTSIVRSDFQFGETIALTTTAGYDYYANDEKIEDTDNFVIPDAETVTITAVEQERELHSATYTGGTFDADLWNTSTTLATDANGVNNTVAGGVSYKTPFNNGYIEADLTLSGAISNSALMYVHSPNNTNKNGGEDEILIRWNVAADTSKDGYTHYAQASFIIRDTDANGYDLDNEHGANIILATSAKIYFNTSTTMKVRMQAVGNLITVTVDGTVLFETTLNPDYAVTTNAGYFGLAFAGSVTQETARFSNVVVQELKTYSVQNDAAAGVELETIEDLAMKRLVSAGREGAVATNRTRTHYAPGEIVTLKVDESVANVSTLKVNGGAVEVTGSNGTYTFTMPAEAVTVTCDKLVTYAITEAVDGLSVDKTEAPAGATVTITLDETTLDAATLKVNDGAVTIDGADGVYTFTMPAGDVTITCSEKQLAAEEELTSYVPTGDVSSWSYSDKKFTDGIVEVDIQLPTISKDDLAAARVVGTKGGTSNPNYAVSIKTGSYSVTGTLFLWRNSSSTQLRFDTSAGLCADANQRYTFADNLDALFYDGSLVTFRIAKVGNFIQVQLLDGETVAAEFSYTVPEDTNFTNATEWTVSVAANAGLLYTAYDDTTSTASGQLNTTATIKSAVVKRINRTVMPVVDGTIVKLPDTYSVVDQTTVLARTAYYAGEIIALNVDESADLTTLKANGTVIADPANFVIPDAETVTITCDAAALEPFYTNDFSANYDGLTLGSISLDSVECGRFTHTDGQLVITKDAGVDKNAQILATMASHDAVLANGFVTSLDITAYKQKTAEGADTTYPWILFTVNNKIQFRVIPAPTEDAPNRYGFVINNGESAGWVDAEGTGTSSVVWHYIELPGTMNTGTDGGVTYNVAVKLVGNAYTMYINGQQVFAGTTTADLSTNKVTFGGATSGGNTRGFTLKFDNLRIDHVGAVDNVIFGQKQLKLDADLAMDFYIALPSGSTATTATITLGDEEIDTVTLADADRGVLYTDTNGDNAWISWYIVTAKVPVKDIAKDVTVTLDDGSTYSYSVEDYADYIVNTAGYSESVKKVAQSLLDYGTVAATYFADRSGSATLDAELSSRLDVAAIANTWAPTKTGTNEYISLYGCSLEAVEDANICMYFQLVGDHDWPEDGSNVSVTVNGEAVTNFTVTDAANGYKRVKITGIHAADLDVVYTVTVTSEYGDLTVSYSGLSYAYTAANYSAGSVNLKALAKALYNYWDAAQNMN